MTDKELLALEERRFAAMIARDFGMLEALVHEELRYTHSSGVTDGKASWLESMRSGRVKYDTALISGRAHIEGWQFVAWQSTPLPA
jgi:Domain of unknown function (DUF4440)